MLKVSPRGTFVAFRAAAQTVEYYEYDDAGNLITVKRGKAGYMAADLPSFARVEAAGYRTTPDWPAELLRTTGGVGADIIVETGGQATLSQSIAAAAPNAASPSSARSRAPPAKGCPITARSSAKT